MSHNLTAMAWHTEVATIQERMVLLRICDHARDDTLQAWPSLACLMNYTKLSRRSVQRALAGLERREILIREKGRGRYQTDIWHINLRKMGSVTPDSLMEGSNGGPEGPNLGPNLKNSYPKKGVSLNPQNDVGRGVPQTPMEETEGCHTDTSSPLRGVREARRGVPQAPGTSKEPVSTGTPLPPEGEERESGHPLSELVDRLWEIAPKVSRKRSSKAKVLSALQRLRPAADEQERMVRWLRRRVREEDWSQGDGQFMPALDRVIRAKAWRDEPDEGAGAAGEEAGGRGEEWEDTSRLGPEVSLPEPAWDWWPAVQEISQETGIDLERGFSWYRLPREWQDAVMRSGPPESGESGKNAAA